MTLKIAQELIELKRMFETFHKEFESFCNAPADELGLTSDEACLVINIQRAAAQINSNFEKL